MSMLNLPSLISLSRFALAGVYLIPSPGWRLAALIAAIITDFLDGFLARMMRLQSLQGALLDAWADKFFVSFAMIVFCAEGKLALFAILALLARDIGSLLMLLILLMRRTASKWKVQATLSSKLATCVQFAVLVQLTIAWEVETAEYWLLAGLGLSHFLECCLLARKLRL